MLLKILLEGAIVSGQSTLAAGRLASNSNIEPEISSRFFWNTGVGIESLLLVTTGSRQ